MFRFLVLGLLKIRSPRHGYALMKEYEQRSGMRISSGTFYRELKRLAGAGLVRIDATSPAVDQRRALYSISDKGVAALLRWLAHPIGNATGVHHDELFARIVLLTGTDPEAMRCGLRRWRDELSRLAGSLERSLENADDPAAARGQTKRARWLMEKRRLAHIRVDLELIDQMFASFDDRAAVGVADSSSRDCGKSLPLAVPRQGRSGSHRPVGRGDRSTDYAERIPLRREGSSATSVRSA